MVAQVRTQGHPNGKQRQTEQYHLVSRKIKIFDLLAII
jgi:hypothetical protein